MRSTEPPIPSVDRIDYSNPERYLHLQPSFGRLEELYSLAGSLKSSNQRDSLRSISLWINRNLQCDDSYGYDTRKVIDILTTKKFGGCAEFAFVFTALARACEIPTVFVKTMDIDWIKTFVSTGECQNWRGHVFLEVYCDGQWRLLEPINAEFYDDYKPTMRILPGERFCYDKGDDPSEVVLSFDWQRWKIQANNYFKLFDLAEIKFDPSLTPLIKS